MDTSGLEGHHLYKRFGRTQALYDVSIRVRAGETVALLGPNGAGKTTLLNILSGLLVADTGDVFVRGSGPHPDSELAYIPDNLGFWPHLTGLNNLDILLDMCQGRPSRASLISMLERVGLAKVALRRCGGYSLGEKRRLALAMVLLRQPRILLLDEPTVGLDVDGVRLFREALHQLAAAGCAILLSSHQLTEVERLADAVAFMHLGTLAELGPLSPLLEAYGKWHLRVEDSTRLVEAIRAIRGVTRVDVEGDLVAIWSPIDPTQAVMNVVRGHGTAIRQWSFAPATLEDIWSHAVSTHSAVGAVPDAEG